MQRGFSEQLLCNNVYKAEIIRKPGDIKIEWEQFSRMDFNVVFYVNNPVRIVDIIDEVISKCKEVYREQNDKEVSASVELSMKNYLRRYLGAVVEEKYSLLGVMDSITIETDYLSNRDDTIIDEAVKYVLLQLENRVPVIAN